MSARERHAWTREAEHRYRCTRCGCEKTNVLRPGRTDTDPGRWVATFTWGAQTREGLTPPCPGHPAPTAAPQGLAHVLDHVPALAARAAETAPGAPDVHRGGCWFCRHIRHRDMACLHPKVGVPTLFLAARESGERCGPNGNLWERG